MSVPAGDFWARYHPAPTATTVKKFVIVAAERTGTNLLVGLLNDYDRCFVGNELFNPVNISGDVIPWRDISETDVPALLDLRRTDPITFWKDLCDRSAERGYRTIGFKLLYAHGLAQKDLLEHLVADETIPIIHLTRRNLLRRLVSERQAYATSKWAVSASAPVQPRPAVAITMSDILASIRTIETQQVAFDALFAGHPMLKIVYEDFAERPVRVAERAAEFSDLPPPSKPAKIKHGKTGTLNLSQALVDFDALRAKLERWASFFDE